MKLSGYGSSAYETLLEVKNGIGYKKVVFICQMV